MEGSKEGDERNVNFVGEVISLLGIPIVSLFPFSSAFGWDDLVVGFIEIVSVEYPCNVETYGVEDSIIHVVSGIRP